MASKGRKLDFVRRFLCHINQLVRGCRWPAARRKPKIERAIRPTRHGESLRPKPRDDAAQSAPSRKVSLVNGRDENAKNEVALSLRKIGPEDIVLHLRPNRRRRLLTKFQEEAQGASFAVVLMTPDDEGGVARGSFNKRARRNVVLELGFFIGRFDTARVAALPGVEKPSGSKGICWIEFGRGTTRRTN
jgi:predicted nucleotide-binding protein